MWGGGGGGGTCPQCLPYADATDVSSLNTHTHTHTHSLYIHLHRHKHTHTHAITHTHIHALTHIHTNAHTQSASIHTPWYSNTLYMHKTHYNSTSIAKFLVVMAPLQLQGFDPARCYYAYHVTRQYFQMFDSRQFRFLGLQKCLQLLLFIFVLFVLLDVTSLCIVVVAKII